MNHNFEFKQLLRAYRAGIIDEVTFECEMGAIEHSNGNGAAPDMGGFRALGRNFKNEQEALASMLDRFRAGEANGEVAFSAWAKQCSTECIRSGIRIIAEREGYHARIFERRMRDLGLECKAPVTDTSRKITEYLGNAEISDKQKLLYITSLAPDIDAFFKPVCDFTDNIKGDMESKELFKLYVQDELSSARWLMSSCAALNGPAEQSASMQSGQNGAMESCSAESFV